MKSNIIVMKRTTLRTVNILMATLLLPVAVTSIFLECLEGSDLAAVRNVNIVALHLAVAMTLFVLCGFHIKAHFGNIQSWFKRLKSSKFPNRFLFWISVLTLLTGVIATLAWLHHGHSPIGGVHGKIGFLALIVMFAHLIRRRKRL